MPSHKSSRGRTLGVLGAFGVSALVLAGCAAGGNGGADNAGAGGGSPLLIGTTDKITSIDPAGSYDNGSFAVMNQIYPFLMNTKYGSADVTPDIATKAEFTNPTEYTVTLKPGLKFANGHDLTSSDVKFTFDRVLKINAADGPASLLGNLDSIDTPDDTTVVFHLKHADQTWPQVLSSPAAPIVDEQVFSADKVTPDQTIVKGDAFAGQYKITSYQINQLINYVPNTDYKGELGAAANKGVTVKYYADASNMKLAIGNGDIDVAYRSLSATDIDSLSKNSKVKIVKGPGGEIRYMVFNMNTMPFGVKAPGADPAKALAVREAMADLIDRDKLASEVYKGTYTPLYSYVAEGLTGATDVLKGMYGDGKGGPDVARAKDTLTKAGITSPVTLNIQYNGEHYGPSSGDEYAALKTQLEQGGLFKVNLAQTEWVQYSKDRVADVYPIYQLGWFPDFSDADNYLQPFFSKDNFVKNHYDNAAVQDLIAKEETEADAATRTKEIEQVQSMVAKDLPTLPYLQGAQIAVVGKDVQGTTLDASFKFRYAPIHK